MNASSSFRRVGAAVLSSGLLLLVPVPAAVQAEQEVEFYGQNFSLSGDAQIGLQGKEFSEGTRTSKFEEYQDVPRGFVFDSFQFGIEGKANPLYLRFFGKDISQDDQFFDLTFGRYGEFRFDFQWDEIPHFFSTGSRSLLTKVTDTTFVFNNIGDRQTFTTNDPLTPTAAADAATATLARQLVSNAPTLDLRLQRQRAKGEILYSLIPRGELTWNLRFHIDDEQKDGNRALSTGTYERRAVAGFGDTFRVLGIELPEPIEHRTTQVGFATDLAGEGWLLTLGYDYVNFTNNAALVRWQNPFNNTDELAPGAGGTNRGRFADSQIDLFPDNDSHTVSGSGSVALPFRTQFTANLSSTWLFQDDRFLPYTLNSAILATNVAGTPRANSLALPSPSLDGEVQILTQSYTLTNRAIKDTTLSAFYRFYDYDNRTPSILFPGYAAAADSFWRTSFDDIRPNSPILSVPKSYTRQNAGPDISFRLLRTLTLKAGYEYERWDRENRETEATDEHIFKGGLDFRPLSWLSARASYRRGERKIEGRYERGLEFERLRKFDQANRNRDVAQTSVQVTPIATLSISGSFRYLNDDFDDTELGLKQFNQYGLGAEVSYATPIEGLTLYGFYAYDFGEFEMSSISKAGSTNFNIANQFDSTSEDETRSAGVGLNATLIPSRLFLNLGYNYSLGKGRILTSNPNTIEAANRASSEAAPFPDTETELHSIRTVLNYVFNKNISVGVRYLFEQYRLKDFAWDILDPFIFSRTQDNAVRFLLLDSRYSDYDVHVFGGFLTARF